APCWKNPAGRFCFLIDSIDSIGRGGSPEPPWAIETRSAPALARCFPRSFTFYLADPSARLRSIAPTWNENVGPILFVSNQPGAYRVLTDIRKLLSQTFIMAQAMIEKISLPKYSCQLRSDPLVI